MSRGLAAILAAGTMCAAIPALADAPPQNARPLSQLIDIVEQNDDVAYIEDVDWDDDGYYEVEYRTRNGGDREIRIDPVSGEIRSD